MFGYARSARRWSCATRCPLERDADTFAQVEALDHEVQRAKRSVFAYGQAGVSRNIHHGQIVAVGAIGRDVSDNQHNAYDYV